MNTQNYTDMTRNELFAVLAEAGKQAPRKTAKAELVALVEQVFADKQDSRAKQAHSQRTSMMLPDRAVVRLNDGAAFGNGNQAYKYGFLTSAQCDAMTQKLLRAEKAGTFAVYKTRDGFEWVLAKNVDEDVEIEFFGGEE